MELQSSTKRKIRLLSVIGHGSNLIPNFIKHYSKYVDEIQFVIYQSAVQPFLIDEVNETIEGHENVSVVKTIEDRIFDWEKVTKLYNTIKFEKPNDWWVIADIDEFHLYPFDDLRKCVYDCEYNGWSLMRGGFIDRVADNGEFIELNSNEDIFEQYPNMGFFRYPMSNACPNKVCVMKGNVEITSGQHYAMINGHTTWRWQGWNHPLIAPIDFYSVQVHHFKWDKTCIERIKSVASVKQDYAYSDEYSRMYESLKKNKFKIDINNSDFMFVKSNKNRYYEYTKWSQLIKKITSI